MSFAHIFLLQPQTIFVQATMNNYLFTSLLIFLSFSASTSTLLPAGPLGQFCFTDYNITSKTQLYNINKLLSRLVAQVPSTGYLAASSGSGADRIYGLSQCRADVSNHDCSSCLQDAAKQVRQLCPDQSDARIWYERCFLRYGPRNFVGKVDTAYGIYYADPENVTNPEKFNEKLKELLDKVRVLAGMPKNRGLGTGQTALTSGSEGMIYAMAQCTRDISGEECGRCLEIPYMYFGLYCENRKGCLFLESTCSARYELYDFLSSAPI